MFFAGVGHSPWSRLAVAAKHIYWATYASIGRVNLDGSGLNQSFITGVIPPRTINPYELAVNANYIYWTNDFRDAIGRANLDGTPNPGFIFFPGPSGFVSGVAVDANHIYWGGFTPATPTTGIEGITRANLDGTQPNPSFITGIAGASDIAVVSAPWHTKIRSATVNKERRSATFAFNAHNATRFQCALVNPSKSEKKSNAKFSSCKSPRSYKGLKRGKYKFE